jgi:hypothetical protein
LHIAKPDDRSAIAASCTISHQSYQTRRSVSRGAVTGVGANTGFLAV